MTQHDNLQIEIKAAEWWSADERRVINPLFVKDHMIQALTIINNGNGSEAHYQHPALIGTDTQWGAKIALQITLQPWQILSLPAEISFSVYQWELYAAIIGDTATTPETLNSEKKHQLYTTFIESLEKVDPSSDNLFVIPNNNIIENLGLWEVKIATLYADSFLGDHLHSDPDETWIDNEFELFTVNNGKAVFFLQNLQTWQTDYYLLTPGKLLRIQPWQAHLAYVEANTSLVGIKWEPYKHNSTDKETGVYFGTRPTQAQLAEQTNGEGVRQACEWAKDMYKQYVQKIFENGKPYWQVSQL